MNSFYPFVINYFKSKHPKHGVFVYDFDERHISTKQLKEFVDNVKRAAHPLAKHKLYHHVFIKRTSNKQSFFYENIVKTKPIIDILTSYDFKQHSEIDILFITDFKYSRVSTCGNELVINNLTDKLNRLITRIVINLNHDQSTKSRLVDLLNAGKIRDEREYVKRVSEESDLVTFANSSDSLMEPLEMFKHKSRKVFDKCISSMGLGGKKILNEEDYDEETSSGGSVMRTVEDMIIDDADMSEEDMMEVNEREGVDNDLIEFIDDSFLSVLEYLFSEDYKLKTEFGKSVDEKRLKILKNNISKLFFNVLSVDELTKVFLSKSRLRHILRKYF